MRRTRRSAPPMIVPCSCSFRSTACTASAARMPISGTESPRPANCISYPTSPCARPPASVPDSYEERSRRAPRCPTKSRHRLMSAAMDDMIDHIYALRHERLVFGVMWPAAYQLVQALRRRGVKDGEFHPETVLFLGGGRNVVKKPDDFREQI